MPRYWLSFDLGLRGNYDELYGWLDKIGARECGENVATFVLNAPREEVIRRIRRIIGSDNRAYLIDLKNGGRFVIGKRRPAPWAGYAATELQADEIER